MAVIKTVATSILCCLFFFCSIREELFSHPLPNSIVQLKIKKKIEGIAKVPLIELESALKDSVRDINPLLVKYFSQHIRTHIQGQFLQTQIDTVYFANAKDSFIGLYQTVVIQFHFNRVHFNDASQFKFIL